VAPIRLEPTIPQKQPGCYLATFGSYKIVCWEVVRSAILAIHWLPVSQIPSKGDNKELNDRRKAILTILAVI